MTYQEFKSKNFGKYVDWDGQYGPQCWDLAQCYVVECLGVPEWVLAGCGSAKNLMYEPKLNDILQYFDEVPVNAMAEGDLCVWDWHDPARPDGHVAIFDNWDGRMCHYLSQNPGPCHLEVIDGGTMKAFRRKQDSEIVDQILHVGSKVKLTGIYKVKGVNTKDDTALINIAGIDYWIKAEPLEEV